jgi:hypothetical protein
VFKLLLFSIKGEKSTILEGIMAHHDWLDRPLQPEATVRAEDESKNKTMTLPRSKALTLLPLPLSFAWAGS